MLQWGSALGTDCDFAHCLPCFPSVNPGAEEAAGVFWHCSELRLQRDRVLLKGQKTVASNFILCSAVVLGPFCLAGSRGMLATGVGFVFFAEDAGYGVNASLCSTTLERCTLQVQDGFVSLFP